jgi:hypothetical protein
MFASYGVLGSFLSCKMKDDGKFFASYGVLTIK